MELDWITAQQAADKWGISTRRVQALCVKERIPGVTRVGKVWLIPKNAPKPLDSRYKNPSANTTENVEG